MPFIQHITAELNNISLTIQMTEKKKSEVLSCTGAALVFVFCLRLGRLELRRGNRNESNIFRGISWWKWMKEVPGGGNKRNVLHFQWLLKVQRKQGILLWDPCQSCKGNLQSSQYHAIWHHSIVPSGRGKEVTKRCFSFKAFQYILVPEQKERYDQNSSAKKGREYRNKIKTRMRDDLIIFCAHVPTIPSSFVRMVLLVLLVM